MKYIGAAFFIVVVFLFVFSIWFQLLIPEYSELSSNTKNMKITSTAFENNTAIPIKYTCDGEHINPPLTWTEFPAETKSFVLIVDDPDAPSGTWIHWLVWDIKPTISEISENSVPEGAQQGVTSSFVNTYGAPCPPRGQHRYIFKIFALDTLLSLPSHTKVVALVKAMDGHVLDQAELVGLYSRK